jgi:hypothetical protein
VIGIGAGLLALAAIYLVDLLLTSGEIERGTTIAGVDAGGLTPDEAVAALNAQVLPRYGRPVTVRRARRTHQPGSSKRRSSARRRRLRGRGR